jgi:uracil-DNA glycosylase
MNYEKVAPLLGDWAVKFRPFIESEKFDDIFKFLKQESRERKKICPAWQDTFRAFRECPYSKLRVVFILQDPYPWIKDGKFVADGMAMSCSNTNVCQPSLDLFYDGMQDDLDEGVPHMPDLSYLAQQGVLLLNTSLTVELNKPTSHKGLWDSFMDYMIQEVINFYNCGLIYVSFGKNAHITAKAIVPFLHWGFEVEHPAAAARAERKWEHQKIFTKINKILRDSNNEQINWIYGKQAPLAPIAGKTRNHNLDI